MNFGSHSNKTGWQYQKNLEQEHKPSDNQHKYQGLAKAQNFSIDSSVIHVQSLGESIIKPGQLNESNLTKNRFSFNDNDRQLNKLLNNKQDQNIYSFQPTYNNQASYKKQAVNNPATIFNHNSHSVSTSEIFSLRNIIIYLMMACLVFFFLHKTVFFRDLPFCDLHSSEIGCEPCPKYGICYEGKLIDCENELIIINNKKCGVDEKKEKVKNMMLEDIKNILMKRRGEVECNERSKDEIGINIDELESEILRINKNYENFFFHFKSSLQPSQQKKKLNDFNITEDPKDPDSLIISLNSFDSIKNIKCRAKNFISNKKTLTFSFVIAGFIFICLFIRRNRNKEKLIKAIYKELKKLVKEREMTKEELLERLSTNTEISEEDLEQLWERVESKRIKKNLIHKIMKEKHGIRKEYYKMF